MRLAERMQMGLLRWATNGQKRALDKSNQLPLFIPDNLICDPRFGGLSCRPALPSTLVVCFAHWKPFSTPIT